MKPKVQAPCAPIARERLDGRQVKPCTCVRPKARKRGGGRLVVRLDGWAETAGKFTLRKPIGSTLLT